MHANETPTDVSLVRRLLAGQFPAWADLPIEPVTSSGTVNALYRLGDGMVVRLPRTDWAAGAVDKELRWLPDLARRLPVRVPVPLAKGLPGAGFPAEWGVYPWLDGDHPAAGTNSDALARGMAHFVRSLHQTTIASDEPSGRGAAPLARWDESVRAALATLHGVIDTDTAVGAWDDALHEREWSKPLVWTHGDLMPANLLVQEGSLTAILDWECMGVGDPACDLAVAWNLLSATGRQVFRDVVAVDDATWARGRGWALSTGLVALPYYAETNPELAENARYRIGEVLEDYRASAG